MVHFHIHVISASERADELLAALADQLGLASIVPDEHGTARFPVDAPGTDAYELVTTQLGAIDPAWEDHLYIRRPER